MNAATKIAAAPVRTMKPIVDVSLWQGAIDWQTAAGAVSGAMVKASQGRRESGAGGFFIDPCFGTNVRGALGAGLRTGVYHYLTARDEAEAAREARDFAAAVEPYRERLSLPAAVDVESGLLPRERAALTAVVRSFCAVVRDAGLEPMLYTNPDFLARRLDDVSDFPLWLALWRNEDDLPDRAIYPNLRLWQYGAKRLPGFSVPVDVNREIAAGPAPAEAPPRTYVVRSGDCLWNIAARFLGSGARWREIQSLNALSGTLIRPGDVLLLPD